MSIIDNVKDKVREYVFKVAVGKVVKRVVQLVISLAGSAKLKSAGVDVGVNEAELTVGIYAALEFFRNFLKTKFPKYCGWL